MATTNGSTSCKWVHFAMVNAEELGVTKANVDDMMKSDNPDIKRLLGTEGKHGEALGLTNDWAYRIIKHVGNYGEIFRAECRAGLAAEDRARPERAVDQGRPAIRPADPLSGLHGTCIGTVHDEERPGARMRPVVAAPGSKASAHGGALTSDQSLSAEVEAPWEGDSR